MTQVFVGGKVQLFNRRLLGLGGGVCSSLAVSGSSIDGDGTGNTAEQESEVGAHAASIHAKPRFQSLPGPPGSGEFAAGERYLRNDSFNAIRSDSPNTPEKSPPALSQNRSSPPSDRSIPSEHEYPVLP